MQVFAWRLLWDGRPLLMGEMIRTAKRLQYANGYLDLGMVTDAAAELEAIEKGDQASYETMSMWVRLYSESRDWSKMAALAEQLVALDEKAAYGWVNWAYALRELERVADAKEVATRGLKKHAEEAVLWFNLACYCSLLEEVEDASDHLDKAIELEKEFEKEAVDDPDLDNLWAWIRSKE